MDIDRPVNSYSRSSKAFPFLELPSELVKLVCSFLSLKQVKELRRVSRSLGRMVIKFKEQEEKYLIGKLHAAILKTGVFLTPSEKEELEKLERSQEMKKGCASWEDIGDYEKAWTDRLVEIVGTSPGFFLEKKAVCIEFAQFLHPYAPTPTGVSMQNRAIEDRNIDFLKITYNPQEERSFAPSCNLRIATLFKTLTLYLLTSDEERYRRAIETALKGEYRGEEGNSVIHVLIQLHMLRGRPHTEMMQLARKMTKEEQEKSYLSILDRVVEQSVATFYDVVEEMFEEDLSETTQNQILQRLAKADVSKGVEKALKLSDRPRVQKQALIDIVTHCLPEALLAGEEVCKKILLLMERIGKGEEGDAFEIVRILQYIMENLSPLENFWIEVRALNEQTTRKLQQIWAISFLVREFIGLKGDLGPMCKKGVDLLRPFEKEEPLLFIQNGALYFFTAFRSATKESDGVEILNALFEVQHRGLVRQVIRLLFKYGQQGLWRSLRGEGFYEILDKRMEAVEERQWLEEAIYQGGKDPTYEEVEPKFFAEMIKRFCQNGRRKEEAILDMFHKHAEFDNRYFGTSSDCHLPVISLDLIKEVQTPRRRNQLIMDLRPQDLTAAVCRGSLSFDEVLEFINDRQTNKRKEEWLAALGVAEAVASINKREKIALFFERYRPYITEEIKERILRSLSRVAIYLLIMERLITPQKAVEWIKEEKEAPVKEAQFIKCINWFYSFIKTKAMSIGEIMHFIEEMEEEKLRDHGLNEIAKILAKYKELLPMSHEEEWIQGIEAFLRVANQKGIEACITYADSATGFVDFLPNLLLVAERLRKKEVFLLLIKKVVGLLGYSKTLQALISFLRTLGREGDQESLIACTPYWSFFITNRIVEKGEAVSMIRKIENQVEKEKALLELIKNHERFIEGGLFSREEMLALTEELTDQAARDCYAEEIRVMQTTEALEQGNSWEQQEDFINHFFSF